MKVFFFKIGILFLLCTCFFIILYLPLRAPVESLYTWSRSEISFLILDPQNPNCRLSGVLYIMEPRGLNLDKSGF